MTDKKTETSQDDRARTQSPVLTTPASKRVPPEGQAPAGAAARGSNRSILAPVALVLALVAVGLSTVLWQQNQQLRDIQTRFDSQLATGVHEAQRTTAQLQQLQDRLVRQEERGTRLEQQQAESATVIQDLDEALRHMTDRGSELVLLNDVDHLATIAQQQLELGGNVRNAIVALESAQSQVVRANRPTLAALLQTINGDLDRLRAASTIDIGAFSRQLEELAMLLTEAPLVMPDGVNTGSSPQPPVREHPAPTVPPATAQSDTWWEQAWVKTRDWSRGAVGSIREDLGQFIDVRRVDDASALLMSPDQASRFRDNLRTRVMTAQLALMMRQPEIWKTETEAIVQAIESRYEQASPLTRKALRMARSMVDTSIDTQLPSLDNTLHAINALREQQARNFQGGEPAQDASGQVPDAASPADAGSEPTPPSAVPDASGSSGNEETLRPTEQSGS